MSKIKIELTPEQLLQIESGLHAQMRADKEEARQLLKNDAELMTKWQEIDQAYQELRVVLSQAQDQ